MEWRIGKKIRESAETITALQLATPVDGRLYASPQAPPPAAEKEWSFYPDWEDKKTTYYARVPVVEYGHRSSTIFWHLPHAIGSTHATADRPTGQSRVVALRHSKVYLMPKGFELPKGLRRVEADAPDFADSKLGLPQASRQDAVRLRRSRWHCDLETSRNTLATVAAAPFDYLIDPTLTALSTTVVATIGGVGGALWWLGDTVASAFSWSEPVSRPQRAASSPSGEP